MNRTRRSASREDAEVAALRLNLVEKIAHLTETEPSKLTKIPGLVLYKRTRPVVETCAFHVPGLALIVQGGKTVQLGTNKFGYDETSFLLTSVDLPTINHVVKATPDRPYLSAILQLNLQAARDVVADSDFGGMQSGALVRAIGTGPAGKEVLDAFTRLIALLDHPEDIGILAPLIERELLYRLLKSESGQRLRAAVSTGTRSNHMAEAIVWLKANYRKPLRIDDFARNVKMGVSTLHHHFRAFTAMSPLQYQKHLRLHEARRRLLSGYLDIAGIAAEVGYQSSTQFTREYKRLFGMAPLHDSKVHKDIEGGAQV